ncbi:F-box domain-containing protein [Heracleum sosnowskyi]|uniref:F-box domain-containing protein n=1 Tax=Heracleum sosnowskyi TaxID=360622 RepID=A0AAD8M7W4_9APIA|nr:F-box domain-containing protein [Heracleum sosnowskyi]
MFENLPDDLLVFIFTKLSCSSSDDNNFLEDLKTLGQCSIICKRFNELICLVPTLLIKHANIAMLYQYCPAILKKFKQIRALQVTHLSSTEIETRGEHKEPDFIVVWEADYKPRSYILALVSYKKCSRYFDQDQQFPDAQSLMLPVSARDNEYYESIKSHTRDMVCLHHMLVSSIKEHKYLQRVVVTDLNNRGTLTLEEDTLAELRNCTSTNLDQVQSFHGSGSLTNLDIPLWKNHIGIVLNHVCFNIVKWWDKTMDDHTHKDDDDGGSPNALPGNYFITKALTSILENPAKVEVDDNKDILQLLSDLKCDGNLL